MNIVSNCPLCEAHGLHVMGELEARIMQCLNCGYTSTPIYSGTKETCEKFKELPEDIQNWAKESGNRIWLPVQINLPLGMLCPSKIDDEMKWTFYNTIEIPEDEREKYPDGNGSYYEKTFDMKNPEIYKSFLEAMAELNMRLKDEVENVNPDVVDELTLPKLKKAYSGDLLSDIKLPNLKKVEDGPINKKS